MPHEKPPEGYLSVTQVLDLVLNKPFLAFWRGKIGNDEASRIQRESQEIGTQVHKLIEDSFMFAGRPKWSEITNTTRMVDNFWAKFIIPYEVKPLQLEVTLKDDRLKLQGTFDAVIETSNGQYLMDWKTSSSIDKVSVPLQLAAYAHLYKEINKGGVVRIDKESDKVEIKFYEDLRPYWKIFRHALVLARFIKFGIEE